MENSNWILNEGTISLSGTLISGDVYVVHHSSAHATIQAQGDLSSGSVQHNGDDAVGLAVQRVQ